MPQKSIFDLYGKKLPVRIVTVKDCTSFITTVTFVFQSATSETVCKICHQHQACPRYRDNGDPSLWTSDSGSSLLKQLIFYRVYKNTIVWF